MSDELLAAWASVDDTPDQREACTRAPMNYPGCKERNLKDLLPHLPYDERWIDGFGGTGIVTLARRPSKFEVFNDRHAGIVSFYRCLRERGRKDELLARLDLTVHSREEYNWSRDNWEHDELDDVERAARWYYSVVYSFAGMGRNFGRALQPNGQMSGRLRDRLSLFEEIHARFRTVQVENIGWSNLLRDYDSPSTVFYLDPPFYGKNIYKHNMSKLEHIELCQRIFDCRGFVALSGYTNPVYDKFPWDRVVSWKVRISATTKAVNTDTSNVTEVGKAEAEEFLWIKEFA